MELRPVLLPLLETNSPSIASNSSLGYEYLCSVRLMLLMAVFLLQKVPQNIHWLESLIEHSTNLVRLRKLAARSASPWMCTLQSFEYFLDFGITCQRFIILIIHSSYPRFRKEIIFLQIRSLRKANWLALKLNSFFLFESRLEMKKNKLFSINVYPYRNN